MCIACSSGVPVCAVNAACTASVQQAVAAGAIVGSGFFAIAKTWLQVYWEKLKNKFYANSK